MTDLEITLDEQIACIDREIAMRISVYKRRIASGQMKVADAEREMDRIRAVLKTLHTVHDEVTK